MYHSILVRSSRSAVASLSAIVAVALVGSSLVLPGLALAAHTATVTVSPTLVKGSQSSTYTFNITNNGADSIYLLKIIAPAGFTVTDNLTCPTDTDVTFDWTSSSNSSDATCSTSINSLNSNLVTNGETVSMSITATAANPGSDTLYNWTIYTEDRNGDSSTNTSAQTNVDVTAPTITSITTKDTNGDGAVETATIVFSEAVDDSTFAPNDFSIGGSAGTSISTGTADDTFDVVAAGVAGTNAKDVTYTKSAGAGADMVGNLLANVVTGDVSEVDGAAPIFLSAETTSTTTIDLTFSEDLLGTTITNSDFSVTGFTLTTPDATDTGTPGIVHLTVSTPFGTGDTPNVSYTGSVKDSPNLNTAPNRSDVTPSDGVASTFTATRTGLNTIVLTFSENVDVSTIDGSGYTLSAGTVTANTDPAGTTNTITLTTSGLTGTSATPTVTYGATAGTTVDAAANEVADGVAAVASDGVAPTVTLTSTATSPTKTSPIPMTATFSESVTGFDSSDVVVGNGTAGTVSGSGTTYTFDLTPTGQGTVTVDIAGSAAQDTASNNNTAATQFSITYDSIAPSTPTVTLLDPINNANKTAVTLRIVGESGITYNYSIDDSNGGTAAVTGTGALTNGDLIVSSINVTGLDDGTLAASVTLTDAATNTSAAGTDTATKDTIAPVISSIISNATDTGWLKVGNTITFTLTPSIAEVGASVSGSYNGVSLSWVPNGGSTAFTATYTVVEGNTDQTSALQITGVTVTDAVGNTSSAGVGTDVVKTIDAHTPVAPTTVTLLDPINNANKTAVTLRIVGESGITYNYSIDDSNGGTAAVTGTGALTNGDLIVSSINVTGLDDGTLAASVTLTDAAGNIGPATTDTATKDVAVPSAPAITSIATDNKINDSEKAAVHVIGTAEANSTVSATLTDTASAFVTVNGSANGTGAYDITLDTTTLADGTVTPSVTATDAAGNVSTAATTPTATKDVVAPSAPATPDLTAATDSNIDTDNITNNPTPAFTTTAEAGSTIVVYDGETPVGSMTATAGPDTITVSTLSDGVHSITVKTTDATGNVSPASSALSVTVDTANPTAVFSAATDDVSPVTGALISGQTTDDTALVLSGTNASGSTVEVFNGTSSLGQATITTTTWSYTATIVDGTTYQFNVKETDVAGNISLATNNFTVIGDTTAPPPPVISSIATDNKINDSEKAAVHVIGTAEANSTVSATLTDTASAFVTVNGSANGTGAYDITLDTTTLADGTVTPSVTATDAAGNVSTAATTPTATKDVVAPSAPATPDLTAATDSNIDTDNITNNPTPAFTTTAEAGSTIVVYDGETPVGSMTATAGPDTITVSTLSDGVHSITVKTTDATGNVSPASSALSVTVDTANPTAVFSAATDDVSPVTGALISGQTTDDTALVLSGTNASGSTVEVFNGTSSLGQATITTTTWSYTATIVDGTTYQFNVKETDVAGNISLATNNFTVIGDTSAPTVSLTEDQADMIVRDADTAVVTATFNEAMIAPTISIGSVVTNASMTNTSGNVWTYSWNVPVGNDGSAVVTVAGSDTAGNAYAGTDSLTFTIDNIAPVVAITAPAADARVNASQVITFTDGESTTPQCSIDDSVWVTCTSGVTTLNDVTGFSSLANGSFTLYLRDTDTAGNVGTTQVALVKDTAAPSVSSKTPGANAVGIDPAGNITVVFSENVVISAGNVTGVTASVTGSGTNTATINPTSDLATNTTYTITLTGVTDTAGNALPTTNWSFTTSGSYSLSLTNGWNLISLPVVPTNTDASAVLGALDVSTTIDSVWKYDPEAGTWGVYHPGSPGTSDFSTMTAGEGYWVSYLSSTPGTIAGTGNLFQEGNSTPPQKTLAAGWNLIGYFQLENTTTALANNALSTVTSQWTQLRTYNNTTKQFQSVIGTDSMGPGAGYWIFMKSSSFAPYLYGPGTSN